MGVHVVLTFLCRYTLWVGASLWLSVTKSVCSAKSKFDPWVWKIPWRRKWQSTPVFLLGKPHGLLLSICPKESDMIECLSNNSSSLSWQQFLFTCFLMVLKYCAAYLWKFKFYTWEFYFLKVSTMWQILAFIAKKKIFLCLKHHFNYWKIMKKMFYEFWAKQEYNALIFFPALRISTTVHQ